MSMPSLSPRGPAKTELETVVHWPLLVGAAGLGLLLLAVPLVLACIAARKGGAVKDKVAVRAAVPAARPANVAPVAEPPRPIASYVPPPEVVVARPVYVRKEPPPIEPAPVKRKARIAAAPPPVPDPVLQISGAETPLFKRLDELPVEYLLRQLAGQAKVVDLESVKGTREKLLPKTKDVARRKGSEGGPPRVDAKSPSSILALRVERPDLKGLPMRAAEDCRASAEVARKRQVVSRALRNFDDKRGREDHQSRVYRTMKLQTHLTEHPGLFQDDVLSTLAQMLQVEESPIRHTLVKRVAAVKGGEAGDVLVRHALFDLSPSVREEAVKALKDRPPEEYRSALLDGLRYPWSPVAAHAAEALVALEDYSVIFRLAGMLDEPDPRAPVLNKDKKWVVKEVVRVNHLRNCLLCHAPSADRKDWLRGVVPTPGEPLPVVYYDSPKGNFVRADITYLRQDFSLMERVAKPDKWPQWQRFDYMVRTRELTADEAAAHARKPRPSELASYPQRNAVLFALRELTGWDVGEDSADWYELLWAIQ